MHIQQQPYVDNSKKDPPTLNKSEIESYDYSGGQ
jgi:hypothetical protein